ncbi:MAG TPA: monofunctional biosynthetic peptidoglycan transglycosylase [Sphingobacteriaceae bacterium]
MARKRGSSGKRKKSKVRRVILAVAKGILWFFGITVLWVAVYRFVNPPVTWLMVQRGFEQKADDKSWKIEKEWRDLDEISSNLKRAALAGEDAAFETHRGFDVKAIQAAYEANQAGGKIRGGSTISQQTAKNVFLWPGRSWVRKGFEAYFTALIELLWGKERILEVYLNVIETGDGIYGVEAACRQYFNKSSERLSKAQAALLVAVLPNPLRWTPARPTRYINHRQYLIMRNMRRIGDISF